jgi:serine phosphatase RsbU (regulator of sigma subunit)
MAVPETETRRHAVDIRVELDFVVELGRVAASICELKSLLEWIVEKSVSLLRADAGSIKLVEDTSPYHTAVRSQRSESWPAAMTVAVGGYLALRREPLLTPDLLNDARFPGLRGMNSPIRAVLAVPLQVENRLIGMLAVSRRTPGSRWTKAETELLVLAATHSAEVMERWRSRQQIANYDRELKLAGLLQAGLVPRSPLRCGPWEVDGRVVPARHVGGDYFGYFRLDQGRVAVVVADVLGKGLAAALLVSKFSTLVRAFCDGRRPLSDAFTEINRNLIDEAGVDHFITAFCAELDHRRGLLRFVRAGHNYPLVRRSGGGIEALQEGDLPLGPFAADGFTEGECPFGPGDALLLYTDGVTEAMDANDELFGDERLVGLWQNCGRRSAADAIRCVFEEVERFRGARCQNDDMAVVVVAPTDAR